MMFENLKVKDNAMAICETGGIVNTKEMLEQMSSDELVKILKSGLHSRTNKEWATEILTYRLAENSINKG
jgi:hypothetical protein